MSIRAYRRLPLEVDMERTIREAVEYQGGRVFSVRDSRGLAVEDMPDLLIIKPPIVAFIELKSQRRRITAGQLEVLALLERCDRVVSGIVRPEPRTGEMSLDEALGRVLTRS